MELFTRVFHFDAIIYVVYARPASAKVFPLPTILYSIFFSYYEMFLFFSF